MDIHLRFRKPDIIFEDDYLEARAGGEMDEIELPDECIEELDPEADDILLDADSMESSEIELDLS